jgi:2',3'-cyclic-nucleotide 2'-phosphodiesterase (5'-nucleotidase family)
MIFGTYLLAGSTTLPSGQSVFVRTTFQLSDIVTGANPYVVSGGLISGILAGPTDFGIANGQTIINNNTAGTIRFYMWANIQKYGPIPVTFSMSGIGSSFWSENQLSAIPMN